MTIEEAKEKTCPLLKQKCITKECMMWVETISGKKEIHRYKMPYDIYPMDESDRHKQLIRDGYIETTNKVYIKYEMDCFEGYCNFNIKEIKC